MAKYRARFDERLPVIEQAISDMPGTIEEIIPGLTRAKLRRFFQRFSILLGRYDKSGAKSPSEKSC